MWKMLQLPPVSPIIGVYLVCNTILLECLVLLVLLAKFAAALLLMH